MLPVQVLTNNLLYDFSQTTIPMDAVDGGTHGQELWKSDGSAAGTVLVKSTGLGRLGP
jgi:hypothetical protein